MSLQIKSIQSAREIESVTTLVNTEKKECADFVDVKSSTGFEKNRKINTVGIATVKGFTRVLILKCSKVNVVSNLKHCM